MKKRAKSLADIGKLAGVTAATVSRALNNSPEIGEKTKARIKKIAADHNYVTNESARKLRLQKTSTIAVILNTSDEVTGELGAQPYTLGLIGSLSDELAKRNFDMIVSRERNVAGSLDRYFLTSRKADGLIILGQGSDVQVLEELGRTETPFVVLGSYVERSAYCIVGADSRKGGHLATRHLIVDGGRKKVLYLGPTDNFDAEQRISGYKKALADAGIPFTGELVRRCPLSARHAYEVLSGLLETDVSFDGIFACNDEIAFGAIKCLHDSGISVPLDVSVAGFDDIPNSRFFTPPLTTVHQKTKDIAAELVQQLVQGIEGEVPKSVEIDLKLVVRKSSVPEAAKD